MNGKEFVYTTNTGVDLYVELDEDLPKFDKQQVKEFLDQFDFNKIKIPTLCMDGNDLDVEWKEVDGTYVTFSFSENKKYSYYVFVPANKYYGDSLTKIPNFIIDIVKDRIGV